MVRHTFEVPQGNVDTGYGRHEYGSPAIEAQPPSRLPQMLNVTATNQPNELLRIGRRCGRDSLGLIAHKSLNQGVQGALDGLGVALEGGLAPALVAIDVLYEDEQPARESAEILDALDLDHDDRCRLARAVCIDQRYRAGADGQ